MGDLGNRALIAATFELLKQRLPPGWTAELQPQTEGVDAYLRIAAPDGSRALLMVEAKRQLDPRGARDLIARSSKREPLLVAAGYLSRATRERLVEGEINYIDEAGNIRLVLPSPGLFIEAASLTKPPSSSGKQTRSLRGGKAGRVVRYLIDHRNPGGVREIAQVVGVDAGYASRLLAVLDRETLIERDKRGAVAQVNWVALLRRWAEEAPLSTRGPQRLFLEPRGISGITGNLSRAHHRPGDHWYAVTGSVAATRFAPVAVPRLITLYVDNLAMFARTLGLRETEGGANVLLIQPTDEGVFTGASLRDEIMCVTPSQAAADLLTSPGRGPNEGEELLEWMRNNEATWRE